VVPLQDFTVSATYFDIDYRNKIQGPGAVGSILQLEGQYVNTGVITRNPTQTDIAALCSQPTFVGACDMSIAAIIDARLRNLALAHVDGLDGEIGFSRTTGVGTISDDFAGTYTFRNSQAITPLSPTFSVLDTVGNPLALRLRNTLSWALGIWSAGLTVNHSGRYEDPSFAPPRTVAAWTTADVNLSVRFGHDYGWLAKTSVFLTVTNVFDKAAPFDDQPLGFDAANSSLIGRTGSLQVVKEW
jgi:iron complex outermembrane receptor protein